MAALVLLARALPFDTLIHALRGWIASLGFWGPVAFAALYALGAVLFLPGSALTLAGGAIFGLVKGTATVLVGATAGAGLSFLIARHFARDRVEGLARSNRKFAAIDRAIERGGWKIVAMLRLSPAMPFNVQNYLYGVTAIRFWPCLLTSAVFMIPGSFLYVYLGHLAGQGLAAASGGEGRPIGQWILLGVGLAATAAVSVYVTRLARKALKEQAELPDRTEEEAAPKQVASLARAVVMAVVAALVFASAVYAYGVRDSLKWLFGPPRVSMREAYAERPGGPTFDHACFTMLLEQVVDADGWVDYEGMQGFRFRLEAYLNELSRADLEALGRNEKLALLINAYNAFTLQLILDHYPVDSIRSIPESQRWAAERWTLGGKTFSLRRLEHEEIRTNFIEPRIHFALVCAAAGCPPLRREAYTGATLDAQLEDQARYVHAHDRWVRYEPGAEQVELTALYDWYAEDFKQTSGSVLEFAGRYAPAVRQALDAGTGLRVRYLDYDWSLNAKR